MKGIRHIAVVASHMVVDSDHTKAGFVHTALGSGHKVLGSGRRAQRNRTTVDSLPGSDQKVFGFGRMEVADPGVVEVAVCCSPAQALDYRAAEELENTAESGKEVVEIDHRIAEEDSQSFAELKPAVATGRANWHKVVAMEVVALDRSPKRPGMLGNQT